MEVKMEGESVGGSWRSKQRLMKEQRDSSGRNDQECVATGASGHLHNFFSFLCDLWRLILTTHTTHQALEAFHSQWKERINTME